MYKSDKAIIKIDRNLYNEFKGYADTISMSVTKLIQFCLKDFLSQDGKSEIENSFIQNKTKTVKISLGDKETAELEAAKKAHGFTAMKHECEFRILNSLKEKKEYYTNMDIENFIKIRTELNAIGKNLNVIARKVRAQESAKIEIKNLEKFLEYIQDSIYKTVTVLRNEIEKNRERF